MNTFKQVWQMICRSKLFSGIYIFGTALALATVTVGAVVFYNKIAPVYPEYQRSRTAYMQSAMEIGTPNTYQSSHSLKSWKEYFSKLKNFTEATVCYDAWGDYYAQPADGGLSFRVTRKATDPGFFRIYSLDFLAGSPFSQADFGSGLRKIVITEKTARKVYATDDYASLLGRPFSLDFTDYTVCGVVREGTPTEIHSFGNVFIPYTSLPDYDRDIEGRDFVGNYDFTFLTDDFEALRAEVADIESRYNNSHSDQEVKFFNQPTPLYTIAITGEPYQTDEDSSGVYLALASIFLVLLIVPALNLSGIISGQMESRVAEMGVRKAFGAGRGRLLGKVLWENLILTVIGGILGFIIASIVLKCGIIGLFVTSDFESENVVTSEMIFAPAIFVFAFLVCCLLNLFSALLPAWRSLRNPIVTSLKS